MINIVKELQAFPKECEWVEFKVDNSNPQEIGEYISALSNSSCYHNQRFGYLVFGVENKSHRIIGTSFKPARKKVKGQELENWLATQLNPRIDFSFFEVKVNNLPVVVVRVDSTLHTPVKFRGVSYIRVGSYKKKLQEHPEKERKIWSKDSSRVFEKEIAISNVTQTQVTELLDYPSFFELLSLPIPSNSFLIIEKLIQEKIIIERTNSTYDITNLGAILFAKNLNEFDKISRKAIRVIFYDGNTKRRTLKEQTGQKGYAVGFEGLINFIHDRLPSNEIIEKAIRKEVPVFPILAIRELVANAIIHQEFAISGSSPMIEIFDNRIEITNPGKPLIDPLRFIDHSPESRNEKLASYMRRVGICEERGSGIDKVIHECEVFQLPAPDFIVGEKYTRAILYSPRTLRQMDKRDKVRACYQHCCLKYVMGEYMTNESLRERFGIKPENYSMASRIISDTIKSGFIKDYDPESTSKKYAKYIPIWA